MFKRRSKQPTVRALKHLFHGIAIEAGPACCEAARCVAGIRYLSDEAPRLPLESCTNSERCQCVYRHFSDRRTEVRRDTDAGLPPRPVLREKRNGTGRRITDY